MSKTNKDGVDLEQYKLELTQVSVKAIFELYTEEKRSNGDLFAKEFVFGVLASLICTMVHKSLVDPTAQKRGVAGADEAGYRKTRDSFLKVRDTVENVVASGFNGALEMWNPNSKNPEYTCEISVLPEPGPYDN